MKNAFVLAGALFFTAVSHAQTDTTARTLPPPDTTSAVITLIDTSVGKAYVTHPEKLKGLTTETLTSAHIFPALGTYTATGTSTASVTITLDETNKGMIWVEGLPQGRFKALMKKAPATYKVPAQKAEDGKSIPEGTLYLNPETNELTIVLGKSFNDAEPTAFITAVSQNPSSKKSKVWQYTGLKNSVEATIIPQASEQQ